MTTLRGMRREGLTNHTDVIHTWRVTFVTPEPAAHHGGLPLCEAICCAPFLLTAQCVAQRRTGPTGSPASLRDWLTPPREAASTNPAERRRR